MTWFQISAKQPDKPFAQTIAHGLVPDGGYIDIDNTLGTATITRGNATGHVQIYVPKQFQLETISWGELTK